MTIECEIEDFHRTTDGEDWLPAFERAQDIHGTSKHPYSLNGGFTLRFGARAYRFSGPAHVACPMVIQGCGVPEHPGTYLLFPKGSKGIVVHGSRTHEFEKYRSPPRQSPCFAQGTIIANAMVLAVDPATWDSPANCHAMTDFREGIGTPNPGAHGITAYTKITLRDVSVGHFDGHGIYIFGNGDDDQFSPGTSSIAAFCQIDNCIATTNGGDGLHIFGNDASGAVIIASEFIHNAGWGVNDLSRLGQSTYVSGQSAYNVLGSINRSFNIPNRDYESLVSQLTMDLPSRDMAGQAVYNAIIAALPGAIAAAAPKPDVAASYPLVADPLQLHVNDVAYWQQYRGFCDAWEVYLRQIGDGLQTALTGTGLAAAVDLTHNSFLHPYAVGGAVIINFYAEGNGTGDGTRSVLGLTNMTINSDYVGYNTDALGWSAAGYQNTFYGDGGLSARVLKSTKLELESPIGPRSIAASPTKPTDNQPPGTLVINAAPVAGGYVGWVSLGGGNWNEFGPIA